MRFLISAVLLALVSLPASAAVSGVALSQVGGGVCVDLTTTGGAEVRVRVEDRPDIGSISALWDASGTHSLKMAAQPKEGFESGASPMRAKDRGRDAQGRQRWTVWISTTADAAVPFLVEILEGGSVLATHRLADIPAGGSCAALPQP